MYIEHGSPLPVDQQLRGVLQPQVLRALPLLRVRDHLLLGHLARRARAGDGGVGGDHTPAGPDGGGVGVGVVYGGLPQTMYGFFLGYLNVDAYAYAAATTVVALPWSFKFVIR